MASFPTRELLQELRNDTLRALRRAESLQQLPEEQLRRVPAPGKWSIAQVLEHLNTYHVYYLPQMNEALKRAQGSSAGRTYASGWMGNYFTKMMQPNEKGAVANKMKAAKNHHPGAETDGHKALAAFIDHQEELLRQLELAGSVDMAGVRVPISISPFIRLKLGDTFRFNVAHINRHFVQVERTLEMIGQKTG